MSTLSKGKYAVVTGGTSGIGGAVVQRLLGKGWDVVSVSRRNIPEESSATAQPIGVGSRHHVAADLAKEQDVFAAARKIRELVPRIDLLLNCAGSIGDNESLGNVTYCSVQESLGLHALAPLFLTRELSDMLQAASGAVIHIGSIYGEIADTDVAAYCLSKSLLAQLVEMQARAYAPKVRVNLILPGHIDTPMTRAAPQEFISSIISKTPLGGLGKATDVASLVEFLASDNAKYITGATLRIDGGYMAGAGLVA